MPDLAELVTAAAVLEDPSASEALKAVVRAWQTRDVVDAANEAAVLLAVSQAAVLARFGGVS